MALGLLATTERSDEIQIALPAELSAQLADAVKALRESAGGERRERWDSLAERLPADGPGALSAPREALRELLAVAIDDAGERIARAAANVLRGDDASAAELRARCTELGALLDLFELVLRG